MHWEATQKWSIGPHPSSYKCQHPCLLGQKKLHEVGIQRDIEIYLTSLFQLEMHFSHRDIQGNMYLIFYLKLYHYPSIISNCNREKDVKISSILFCKEILLKPNSDIQLGSLLYVLTKCFHNSLNEPQPM